MTTTEEMLGQAEMITGTGVTYRQLDWWTGKGWIRAENSGAGSGNRRRWPAGERLILVLMAALVDAAVAPSAAAGYARVLAETGTLHLAPGLTLTLDAVRGAR